MKIKIAFPVIRANMLRSFGPLIDYLLSQNEEVFLLCDYRLSHRQLGYKNYLFPAVEDLPKFCRPTHNHTFKSITELIDIIIHNDINVCITVNYILTKEIKDGCTKRNHKILTAEVQTFLELFLLGTPENVQATDVIYTLSENYANWWDEYINQEDK